MFEKVLVPTDLSEHSKRVLDCVGQLPGVKEVILLNIVAGKLLSELTNAKAKLEELAKYLGKADSTIKTMVEVMPENESISSVIRKVADEEDISLIVMAWANGPEQGSSLGRVSQDVLCYDDTHLLMICYELLEEEKTLLKDLCVRIFSKVLIPTDLSDQAKAVVFFIAGLKGIENLVLLHVVPEEGPKEEMDAKAKSAANALNAIADELASIKGTKVTKGKKAMPPLGVRLSKAALRCRICSKGLNIDCHVASGDVVREINEAADMENVSLIVMSSMGMSSSGESSVGHITYDIANRTMRPVLVVRTDKVPMFR